MKSTRSVLKFGGTSVGSGTRIRHVAHIITGVVSNTEEAFPVVVVSAMSGVTDQLLRIARAAINAASTQVHANEQIQGTAPADECERELSALEQRHLKAAEEAVHNRQARQTVQRDLETAFTGLRRDVAALQRAAQEDGPSGQEKELSLPLHTTAVAAWGERLSVLLVTAAARDIGLQAAAVREEVIITGSTQNERPTLSGNVEPTFAITRADPLSEETRASVQARISPLIERRIVPITAGFIGRTSTGCVTTLGRNGSDYSASVIGAALDCTEVSIYTDVDGVLTADPRIVANTRLLPEISYAEAARLSWFGSKVLHPRTLIPLAPRNIPVRVRNTFRPQVSGTVVGPVGTIPSGAKAITVRHRLALIMIESTDMFGPPENAGQVLAFVAHAGATPVAICASAGHQLSFLIEDQVADSLIALLEQELDANAWRVLCQRNVAACACIGIGFTADPKSPARAITALVRERIPVIAQSASELGILLIVEDQDSESAVRCLHRDLIAPVIPLVRHSKQEKRREVL